MTMTMFLIIVFICFCVGMALMAFALLMAGLSTSEEDRLPDNWSASVALARGKQALPVQRSGPGRAGKREQHAEHADQDEPGRQRDLGR